jgi:hypothetical protein
VADSVTDRAAAAEPFVAGRVSVSPAEFRLVKYDAAEIAAIVAELADRLGLTGPIHVEVDETTPLAKMIAEAADPSSDATITIRVQSGALENTQRFTHFSADHTRESLGRYLLRARDRRRPDFADVADDLDLSLGEHAAWDAYCAGRLTRLGVPVNQQRFRYNYRNRFGFSDAVDARFDELWAADDLGWAELTAAP